MTIIFDGKIGILQRVLPNYRIPFFDTLSHSATKGVSIFAGSARKIEGIHSNQSPQLADHWQSNNIHLFSGAVYLCIQLGWEKWLKDANPDILIVEANPRYLNTIKAIEWMHKTNRKVVGWGLGAPPINGYLSRVRIAHRKKLLSSLDGIISYSNEGAQQYQSLGMPAEKIFVAHNSVSPKPKGTYKSKKSSTKTNIVFLGRLQDRKRVDLLITACKAMPKELQPNLTIIGDGPIKKELEIIAKRDFPNTKFVGNQEGDALLNYLHNADLFVMPGTGGLAIQQAMASSLPVIVAEGDGTQNDLVQPENGWLVSPNNVDSLASTLKIALSNKDKLTAMGKASFLRAQNEFNIEAMAEKFIVALNTISQQN